MKIKLFAISLSLTALCATSVLASSGNSAQRFRDTTSHGPGGFDDGDGESSRAELLAHLEDLIARRDGRALAVAAFKSRLARSRLPRRARRV